MSETGAKEKKSLRAFAGEPEDRMAGGPPWQDRARRWVRWIGLAAVLVLIVWGLRPYTIYSVPAEAGHMMPAYPPGTTLLVHTDFNSPSKLHRGDCVVYDVKINGRTVRMIGRMVGLPGETIVCQKGLMQVNGKPFNEAYLAKAQVGETRDSRQDVTLASDEMYILNDDRSDGILDSRDFGAVKASQVVGKVVTPIGAP